MQETYFFDLDFKNYQQKGRVYKVFDRKTKDFLWWSIEQATIKNNSKFSDCCFTIFDEKTDEISREDKNKALKRYVKI